MGDEPAKTCSYPFLRNMVGFNVDDESMKAVPHAEGELYCHVMTKFAQVGAVLGGLIGGGVGAIRPNLTAMKSFTNGSRNGMLIGLPIGVVATYMRMKGLEKDPDIDMDYAYFDRSYRIRNNRTQVRVDRAAYTGLGVGAVAAATSGVSILSGACAGFAVGTVAGGVYNMATNKQS